MKQRTFAGLDVHARSVTGYAVDELTGEVWQRRLPAAPAEVCGWLQSLPRPVMAAYEAGPTGYGLAGFLTGAGIGYWVFGGGSFEAAAADGASDQD